MRPFLLPPLVACVGSACAVAMILSKVPLNTVDGVASAGFGLVFVVSVWVLRGIWRRA